MIRRIDNKIDDLIRVGKDDAIMYNAVDDEILRKFKHKELNDAEILVFEYKEGDRYDNSEIKKIVAIAEERCFLMKKLYANKDKILEAANFIYKRNEEHRQVIYNMDDFEIVAYSGMDRYATESGRFFCIYDIKNPELNNPNNEEKPDEITWNDILKFNELRGRDFEVIHYTN